MPYSEATGASKISMVCCKDGYNTACLSDNSVADWANAKSFKKGSQVLPIVKKCEAEKKQLTKGSEEKMKAISQTWHWVPLQSPNRPSAYLFYFTRLKCTIQRQSHVEEPTVKCWTTQTNPSGLRTWFSSQNCPGQHHLQGLKWVHLYKVLQRPEQSYLFRSHTAQTNEGP